MEHVRQESRKGWLGKGGKPRAGSGRWGGERMTHRDEM